jgi:hypothetical protein
VIAENNVRRLKPFHINGFQSVFLADEGAFGQNPNESREPSGLTDRVLCGLVVLFPAVINFHICSSFLYFVGSGFILTEDHKKSKWILKKMQRLSGDVRLTSARAALII